jgi:hypothetical protein
VTSPRLQELAEEGEIPEHADVAAIHVVQEEVDVVR